MRSVSSFDAGRFGSEDLAITGFGMLRTLPDIAIIFTTTLLPED